VNRLTAKSRVKNVIWCNGLSVMLPLQVQIRGDMKESKHVHCRCRRRALHDPKSLVVSFEMSYAVWGLHPADVGPELAGSRSLRRRREFEASSMAIFR
jgi:hypothetical protein